MTMNNLSPQRCPLCGEENSCAMASNNSNSETPCWCFSDKVPEALLKQLPPHQRGKVCVCRRCVDSFKSQQQ
ncbi:MAG: cysteine-rich CWC family protein [Motiliproteus sp.]|nr:cysteine-rich CWC family protein [Motiliproteus sp.]MCW9051642.1 cysteine-rich CWC family protein [Motiliproteus sp.]